MRVIAVLVVLAIFVGVMLAVWDHNTQRILDILLMGACLLIGMGAGVEEGREG